MKAIFLLMNWMCVVCIYMHMQVPTYVSPCVCVNMHVEDRCMSFTTTLCHAYRSAISQIQNLQAWQLMLASLLEGAPVSRLPCPPGILHRFQGSKICFSCLTASPSPLSHLPGPCTYLFSPKELNFSQIFLTAVYLQCFPVYPQSDSPIANPEDTTS